ncbi:DUF3574 domain-containing protein [Asaia astilbis]|uniref:DUF3574 domain-containing protein n=1 Tax=Asaia astilbis TaxID=610244 RepID=UPI000470A610|nr:DUF3574 domain-containing protein [Asaia astilbis]
MTKRARLATSLLLLGLAGCTINPAPPAGSASCAGSIGYAARSVTLAFGLSLPGGGSVSEAQWRDFLADTVTPRFPAGFSVIKAQGQWQDTRKAPIIRENSRLIWLIIPNSSALIPALNTIRETYKKRFNQNSVAAFIQEGCASF